MKQRWMAALAALAACALWIDPAASEQTPPMDQAGFTAYVASELAKAVPAAHFAVIAPLTIEVTGTPGGDHTFYANNLYSACGRNEDACEGVIADYVAKMAPVYQAGDPPLKQSDLRIVVRSASYLAQARQTAAASANEVVAAPLAGDLWVVGAADRPTTIEILTTRRLATLHMTPREAMAVGRQNMRPDPADYSQVIAMVEKGQTAAVGGGAYQSSLLAFHDFFRPIAAHLRGPLLVAAPGNDVVFLCDGGRPGAPEDLKRAVQALFEKDDRPLSNQILAWTPTGWTAAGTAGP